MKPSGPFWKENWEAYLPKEVQDKLQKEKNRAKGNAGEPERIELTEAPNRARE